MLSFPSSPTVNQQATLNGRTYRWTGSVWEFVSSGGGSSGLTWSSVPASATASGTAGQIAYDGSYYYVCTEANAWKRTALSSWSLDPFFSSVSLLLHMDGTGSTFTDNSPSPKTITASGNATQSTGQSKWGGKSAYFDGSGDYLSFPDLGIGTSPFVIEMWFKAGAVNRYAQLIGNESGLAGFTLLLNNDNVGQVAVYAGAGLVVASSSGDWTDDAWHHLAFVRSSGGGISLYLDGTRYGTGSYSSSLTSSSATYVGTNAIFSNRDYAGYIDDLRITIGSDRGYTGATIPVPTAPFPD